MKPTFKIGPFVGFLMVMVALIYDGLQALIDLISVGTVGWAINPLINIWSFLTFFFWFKLKGVSFISPKKLATILTPSFLEFFPLVNSLPTWTCGVIIMLAIVYAEDVVGFASPQTARALGKILASSGKILPIEKNI